MKLSTLKKQAQQTTKRRGHKMTWGQPYGNATTQVFSQNGECRICHAHCWLNTHPAPNQIGVSGLAVAVNCNDR